MRAKWLLLASVLLLGGFVALPAPGADDKPTLKELKTAANNLKEIGIAHHNYYDANDEKWPNDITDKDGRLLLSWRVAILPYIEETPLYKQFKLDEPWDSENNKKLVAKMPKIYAPVRGKAKEGETFYQRFVGKNALFTEKGSSYGLAQIPDGTSNTALVVEAGTPLIWSQPGDLSFNEQAPLPGLGGMFDGDFHLLFCDGSVYLCKKNYDADTMKKVIMPADGYPLDTKKILK